VTVRRAWHGSGDLPGARVCAPESRATGSGLARPAWQSDDVAIGLDSPGVKVSPGSLPV